MYSIYQQAAIKCIFRNLANKYGYDLSNLQILYRNDIPYIKNGYYEFFMEYADFDLFATLLREILQIYDIQARNNSALSMNGLTIDTTIIDFKVSCKWRIIKEGNKEGKWRINKIYDLKLYTIVGNSLRRLCVMFLVDPLAFINMMRPKINMAHSKDFFDKVEYYVNKKVYTQLSKYCMWKIVAYEENIINDVSCDVVCKWIQLECQQIGY